MICPANKRKLLKQDKENWKQIEPCISLVPEKPNTLFFVCALLCIHNSKTSKWIRMTDNSRSSTVTDLADYFHGWQFFFSASPCTVIECSTICMSRAIGHDRAKLVTAEHYMYRFIGTALMKHQPMMWLIITQHLMIFLCLCVRDMTFWMVSHNRCLTLAIILVL